MRPLRIAVLGTGNRVLPKNPEGSNFLGWAGQIKACPGTELVAAQDVDEAARRRMVERGLLPAEVVFESPGAMLDAAGAEALLVCTPGPLHAEGVELAASRGLHVLCEKPLVTDLEEGRRLAELTDKAGIVTTVVQNWRYKSAARAARSHIASGGLGRVGHIFMRYVRNRENPNYPAYLFEEQHPMLYAMGSHHLDLFRHLLGEEMREVRASSFKPPWSLYRSVTGYSMELVSQSGVFISYVSTISSPSRGMAQESWVIEGENGTLANDSDWLEPPLVFRARDGSVKDLTEGVADPGTRGQYDEADAWILKDFAHAVAEGRPSACPLRDSLASIALLEACRKAAEAGETVRM